MLSAEWEKDSVSSLLQMIVTQWVKIRGFAYASAWLEKYKAPQKKTTQRSEGIIKHLTPKPSSKDLKATHCSRSRSCIILVKLFNMAPGCEPTIVLNDKIENIIFM